MHVDFVVMLSLKITEQIEVRTLQSFDVRQLVDQLQNRHIIEWLCALPHPYTMDEGFAYVAGGGGTDWRLGIIYNKLVLGGIGIAPSLRSQNAVHVGYWINPEIRGRGYMPICAARVIDAYNQLHPGFDFVSTVEPANLASLRVMDKLGFEECGSITAWSNPRNDYVPLTKFRKPHDSISEGAMSP